MKIKHKADYKAQRASAYPAIEEQLDILFHEGYDAWKEVIATIKASYPKGD